MPLLPGKLNVGHNIQEMIAAGHPRGQAIAAALRAARAKALPSEETKDVTDSSGHVHDATGKFGSGGKPAEAKPAAKPAARTRLNGPWSTHQRAVIRRAAAAHGLDPRDLATVAGHHADAELIRTSGRTQAGLRHVQDRHIHEAAEHLRDHPITAARKGVTHFTPDFADFLHTKIKDSNGHEHAADSGQFTSGGGGTADGGSAKPPSESENLRSQIARVDEQIRSMPRLPIGQLTYLGDDAAKWESLHHSRAQLSSKLTALEAPERAAKKKREEDEHMDELHAEMSVDAKRVASLPVNQRRNGWEIVKDQEHYVIRNPHTKEEVYRNHKLGRVRSVADEGNGPEPVTKSTRFTPAFVAHLKSLGAVC